MLDLRISKLKYQSDEFEYQSSQTILMLHINQARLCSLVDLELHRYIQQKIITNFIVEIFLLSTL